MGKAFDLRPQKKRISKQKIKFKLSQTYIILLVILIFIISGVVGYWYSNKKPQLISNQPVSVEDQESDALGDEVIEQYGASETESTENITPNENIFATSSSNEQSAQNTIKLSIKYFNGASVETNSKQIFDKLIALGYPIEKIEKTKNYYPTSIIYYKNGKQADAEKVKKDIGSESIEVKESSIVGEEDLWIVIGNK